LCIYRVKDQRQAVFKRIGDKEMTSIMPHIQQFDINNQGHIDAFRFLHEQFALTDANTLNKFIHHYRQGQSSNIEFDMRNVARFFNDKHHEVLAVNFLSSNMSPQTFQMFDDIFFGKKLYTPNSNFNHPPRNPWPNTTSQHSNS
jgi:hypothetical protein